MDILRPFKIETPSKPFQVKVMYLHKGVWEIYSGHLNYAVAEIIVKRLLSEGFLACISYGYDTNTYHPHGDVVS